MPDPFETFLLLSVQLCGISSFDLMGTGFARRYFDIVEGVIGHDLFRRLLGTFNRLTTDPAKRNRVLQTEILYHPEFGPIARNIMKLWYTAFWFQLPPTWRSNFGGNPGYNLAKDQTGISYPYAYPEALLCPAVGGHTFGAKPTGHQSWTLRPKFLLIPKECP